MSRNFAASKISRFATEEDTNLHGIPASFMLQIRWTSSSVYFCLFVCRLPTLLGTTWETAGSNLGVGCCR